jgi:hypothetical protein
VPKELRTSFVSMMSYQGVPVEEIARLAGHASSRTTEVMEHWLGRVVVLHSDDATRRAALRPEKSAADDGHLRIGQLRLLQARAKSKGWCRWCSTCLRVSDAKIADQVTVEFGEQVGVRLAGKGVAEISRSHFADPLAVLVLVINHRGHDHLRHD